MNELPREVLGIILSRLPLKEAARTSVVCRDWRHLWPSYFAGSVEFAEPRLSLVTHDFNAKMSSSFVSLVNRVLLDQLKHCPYLEEVKIVLGMYDPELNSHIDRWISVVKEKHVERFHLSFRHNPLWSYRFSWGCSMSESSHPLKVLYLESMNVYGQTLEQLLSSCPFLEQLTVKYSYNLTRLRVSHGALRKLDVRYCWQLRSLRVVSAPNLVYFKVVGVLCDVSLLGAPRLEEAFFGFPYASFVLDYKEYSPRVNVLNQVLQYSVVKKLTLDLSKDVSWGICFRIQEKIETILDKLMHLDLIVAAFDSRLGSPYKPYDISKLKKTAAPAFRKFVPKLEWIEMLVTGTEADLGIDKPSLPVKKWVFNNCNGGFFTITWCGDAA